MYYRTIKPLYMVCLWLLAVLAAGGCKKYEAVTPLSPAAFLRVFNSINNYDDLDYEFKKPQVNGILTLLIDPVTGTQGVPASAAIAGDCIFFRPFYAAPYETRPNAQFFNTEYPGCYPVDIAGTINGLDISRWARIPAGTHHIMILKRRKDPQFYFENSTAAGRDTSFAVAMDTTLNFSENEAYTLEIHNKDPYDATKLQWYIRKETFLQQQFDTSKVYVNFFNMITGPGMPASLDVYVHMRYVENCIGPLMTRNVGFGSQDFTYSYEPNPSLQQYMSYDTPDSLIAKISGKFATDAPYIALPLPPADSFYYQTGPAIGQYRLPLDRPKYVFRFYSPGQSAATGATPVVELLADEFNSPILTNISTELNPIYYLYTSDRLPKQDKPYLSGLYQTVTSKNVSRTFPLINTIELMSTYTSLNTPSSVIKAFQISLQRPYDPSFIH